MKKLLLALCLCFSAVAVYSQELEKLAKSEPETKEYQKGAVYFHYGNDVAFEDAQVLDKRLRALDKDASPVIYKAPHGENLYVVTAYGVGKQRRLFLFKKNGKIFTQIYQSPVFRGGDDLQIKFFNGENRSLIFAEKWTADYIDTEVFELANGRVKYLGNIPAGVKDSVNNISTFADSADVGFQAGEYHIKVMGEAYIPAGPKSPNKDKLIGTNISYIYDGKRLKKEK